jgi:hypothetical protein
MFAVTQLDPAIFSIPQLPAQPAQDAKQAAPATHHGFSFHDFLSIINPLQHLPIVGTIYRAITGEKIGVPERIAGDALYGGLWGAISGVANAAFEAVTGKDVGETVLALFTGSHDSNVKVASNDDIKPVTITPGMAIPADPNVMALTASLAEKGFDSTQAQRAIFAYRKSMTLPNMVIAAAR